MKGEIELISIDEKEWQRHKQHYEAHRILLWNFRGFKDPISEERKVLKIAIRYKGDYKRIRNFLDVIDFFRYDPPNCKELRKYIPRHYFPSLPTTGTWFLCVNRKEVDEPIANYRSKRNQRQVPHWRPSQQTIIRAE